MIKRVRGWRSYIQSPVLQLLAQLINLLLFVLTHGDVVVGTEPKQLVVDPVFFVQLANLVLGQLGPVVLLDLAVPAHHLKVDAEPALGVDSVAQELNQNLEKFAQSFNAFKVLAS